MTRESIIHDFTGYGKDQETQFIENEFSQEILKALKPHHRKMLIWKHCEGYSYREIGKMIDKKPNNVASTISQQSKKLREKFGAMFSG